MTTLGEFKQDQYLADLPELDEREIAYGEEHSKKCFDNRDDSSDSEKKIKETIYKCEAKIVKLAAPKCPQNHEINLTVEPPEAVLRRCSVKYCS